jgi:hypothetical protein
VRYKSRAGKDRYGHWAEEMRRHRDVHRQLRIIEDFEDDSLLNRDIAERAVLHCSS